MHNQKYKYKNYNAIQALYVSAYWNLKIPCQNGSMTMKKQL